MESYDFLYAVPGWAISLVLLVLCVAVAEAGYWSAMRSDPAARGAKKDHLNAVQAAVAAVLGLLLAFTFTMSVNRFENRKEAVVDEANAIGTAYLRAALLPEPERAQAAEAFTKYVDVRLQLARPDWYLGSASGLMDQGVQLQRTLWSLGVAVAGQDQRAVTTGLYVQALNEMIDSAGRRDAGLRNHVPEPALYMIILVILISLGVMGYTSGLTGRRSLVATILISVVIAAVVFTILDFDRPYRGVITVSQQSMVDLRQSMGRGLPLP